MAGLTKGSEAYEYLKSRYKSAKTSLVDAFQDVLIEGHETKRYSIAEAKESTIREICVLLGVDIEEFLNNG